MIHKSAKVTYDGTNLQEKSIFNVIATEVDNFHFPIPNRTDLLCMSEPLFRISSIYSIPCKNCHLVYTGETCLTYVIRFAEYKLAYEFP